MSTEMKTIISVTGVAKFVTLAAPEPHPDYPDGGARYRLEMVCPKANPEIKSLLEIVQFVARRTWVGAEAVKRLKGVQRTIVEGDGEQTGTIGLLDGDAFKPEYNAGLYVIRASARHNQRPAYRRWDEATGRYAICEQPPEPGDLVRALIEVWAMGKHPRINFTIKAVQVMQGGEGWMPITGGQVVSQEMIEEELDEAPAEVLGLFAGLRNGGATAIAAGTPVEKPRAIAAPAAAPAPAKRGRPKKAEPAPPAPPVDEDEGDDFDLLGEPPAGDEDESADGGSLFAGL